MLKLTLLNSTTYMLPKAYQKEKTSYIYLGEIQKEQQNLFKSYFNK